APADRRRCRGPAPCAAGKTARRRNALYGSRMNWPKATGPLPTGTVVVTLFVPASITDTVLSPVFATYTCDPSRVTDRPSGFVPTGTVATTLVDNASITDTVEST